MRNYAVGLVFAFGGVAVLRVWPLAIALALVNFSAGLSLFFAYRRWMMEAVAPPHRSELDRVLLREWVAAGGIGCVTAIAIALSGIHIVSITTVVRVLQALLAAAAVALSAVFISSLVDWYWILPRIGGLGNHKAPCESPGEKWKYPTAIWLLHRGLATALVVASIAAVPFYLAAVLGNAPIKAILSVVGVAVGGGMAALNQKGLASVTNAFNQPVYVGDTILVNQAGEGEGAPTRRRRAYVVDISVQGVKYHYLDGDTFHGPRFERKGHGPIDVGDSQLAIARVEGSMAIPCAGGCSGINWYCRNNPEAYAH